MDSQTFPSKPQQVNQSASEIPSKSYLPFVIGGLLILFLTGLGGFYLGKISIKPNIAQTPATPQEKGCGREAKICPDGSVVERRESDCEFAPCPTPHQTMTLAPKINQNQNNNSRKYVNEIAGFSIVFPVGWKIPTSVYKNTITPGGDGPGPGAGFQISKTDKNNVAYPVINLETSFVGIEDINLQTTVKTYCSWLLRPETTVKTKEILVDGHKAGYVENILIENGSKHYSSCTLISGKPGFLIVWHNDTEEKGDIEEILSTFKFLDEKAQ